MLRWIILVGSFALWLGCLTIVYFQCKPPKIEGAEAASRAALDRMFSENSVDRRSWNIYIEPGELEAARGMLFGGDKPKIQPSVRSAKKEWTGMNENALVKAGRLDTRIKNKRAFSLDEETALKLDLPGTEFRISYTGTAHLTYDNGIEDCSMDLKLGAGGFEIDALSKGVREGSDLIMTTNIKQKEQTLYSGKRTEKIGGNTALNAELVPFQFNPDVRPGHEWTIVMLDFNLALTGDSQGAQPIRVKCIGTTTVMMYGVPTRAYAVRSDDGTARAWYSPDGVVLKQAYRLAGVLEVVLVRDDKAK